jgi:hypothetical protein
VSPRRKRPPIEPLKPSDAVAEVVAREAFKHLADAVGVYLAAVGWRALLVGNPRVEQQPGDRQFNYEFVVRFTGSKESR